MQSQKPKTNKIEKERRPTKLPGGPAVGTQRLPRGGAVSFRVRGTKVDVPPRSAKNKPQTPQNLPLNHYGGLSSERWFLLREFRWAIEALVIK